MCIYVHIFIIYVHICNIYNIYVYIYILEKIDTGFPNPLV